MTFLFFEILCIKIKGLDQSQDYLHLASLKFIERGKKIESLDKVLKTCLSLLIFFIFFLFLLLRDCECFCNFKSSLYEVRLECVLSSNLTLYNELLKLQKHSQSLKNRNKKNEKYKKTKTSS